MKKPIWKIFALVILIGTILLQNNQVSAPPNDFIGTTIELNVPPPNMLGSSLGSTSFTSGSNSIQNNIDKPGSSDFDLSEFCTGIGLVWCNTNTPHSHQHTMYGIDLFEHKAG